MKYSFMTFSCPQLVLEEVLNLAKQYGYDGIEVRIDSEHKHGVEPGNSAAERNETRRKAEDVGVEICCVATSCMYADPGKTRKAVDHTLRCIDLAGDVDSPRLRVFGGIIPESIDREESIDRLADALRSVADHAADRNVIVCLETHDDWCDPDHVAAVIKKVNHPAVGVNWDIMHPIRVAGATMDSAYETLKPWIHHVHFHDGTMEDPLQFRPIGQGEIDHKRSVELLQGDGYQDYLSGEWIN